MSLRLRIFWGKWQDQKCNTFHNGTNIIMKSKSNLNLYYPATANNLFTTSESPKYSNSQIFFWNFVVYKNLVFAWSKVGRSIEITQTFLTLIAWVCNLKPQNILYRIILENHNKRFGAFEFQYFGGSDVANNLKVTRYFLNFPKLC